MLFRSILIALLSYGLVEVPRHLWNKGNIEGLLRFHKFRVAIQSEALQKARRRLEETLELVYSTDAQLRQVMFCFPDTPLLAHGRLFSNVHDMLLFRCL